MGVLHPLSQQGTCFPLILLYIYSNLLFTIYRSNLHPCHHRKFVFSGGRGKILVCHLQWADHHHRERTPPLTIPPPSKTNIQACFRRWWDDLHRHHLTGAEIEHACSISMMVGCFLAPPPSKLSFHARFQRWLFFSWSPPSHHPETSISACYFVNVYFIFIIKYFILIFNII